MANVLQAGNAGHCTRNWHQIELLNSRGVPETSAAVKNDSLPSARVIMFVLSAGYKPQLLPKTFVVFIAIKEPFTPIKRKCWL